jgi:hypothetical protein
MSRIVVKNLPQIKLVDLLKKKRVSLKEFIHNGGIHSFEALKERCSRMGVQSPSSEEWEKSKQEVTTTPTEGIIVLEPIVNEEIPEEIVSQLSSGTKKRKKKNK